MEVTQLLSCLGEKHVPVSSNLDPETAGYRFGLYSLPTGVPSCPGWDPRGQVKRAQKLKCLETDRHIHKVPCSTYAHTYKHR